jgi:hypothetical protein
VKVQEMSQPLRAYASWLFGIAAAANFAVAGIMVAFERWVAHAMHFDPVTGTNVTLFAFAAMMIALFGYCYLLIARDPVRNRPLIHVGAMGKLLAFTVSALPWAAGITGPRIPMLIFGDVIFAMLFLDFLRRTHVA